MQQLVKASDGRLHLGLDYTFSEEGGGGVNILKPCHLVAIRGVEGQDFDPAKLWVVNDQLRYGSSLTTNEPFTGYDYMLFRIENRSERPPSEWNSFSAIRTPFVEARRMLTAAGKAPAQVLLNSALVAIQESTDLIDVDRWRAMRHLRNDFEMFASTLGLGAVPADELDLSEIMELAMPVAQARALGEPTFDELFVM